MGKLRTLMTVAPLVYRGYKELKRRRGAGRSV